MGWSLGGNSRYAKLSYPTVQDPMDKGTLQERVSDVLFRSYRGTVDALDEPPRTRKIRKVDATLGDFRINR